MPINQCSNTREQLEGLLIGMDTLFAEDVYCTSWKRQGQYDKPIEIFWATGACLCMRRDDYIEAGGLMVTFCTYGGD